MIGPLEKAPIDIEEARLLEILKIPSIYIQFYEVEGPHEGKPLDQPMLWWWKFWQLDLKRRENFKKKKEFERNVCNKQSENILAWKRFLMRRTGCPENICQYAAEKIVINKDQALAKALGIDVQELDSKEYAAAHDYNTMLLFRQMKGKQ